MKNGKGSRWRTHKLRDYERIDWDTLKEDAEILSQMCPVVCIEEGPQFGMPCVLPRGHEGPHQFGDPDAQGL